MQSYRKEQYKDDILAQLLTCQTASSNTASCIGEVFSTRAMLTKGWRVSTPMKSLKSCIVLKNNSFIILCLLIFCKDTYILQKSLYLVFGRCYHYRGLIPFCHISFPRLPYHTACACRLVAQWAWCELQPCVTRNGRCSGRMHPCVEEGNAHRLV